MTELTLVSNLFMSTVVLMLSSMYVVYVVDKLKITEQLYILFSLVLAILFVVSGLWWVWL